VPAVVPATNIVYTVSLATDPLAGPLTASVTIPVGGSVSVRLNQATAGPLSFVQLSFSDGSPITNSTIMSSYVNLTKTFTTGGTYEIITVPVAVGFNGTLTVNKMTVIVTGAGCKLLFIIQICI
jgi:hypothetical protein